MLAFFANSRLIPDVKGLLRLGIVMSLVLTGATAKAGPFADFFHSIRRAFTEPAPKSSSHRSSHKNTSESAVQNQPSGESLPGGMSGPPNERNTRTATRASGSKSGLRYGTPVPGKQGFVTSPFSSDGGYIDVRGFPPGTPVKDPYSGKIFLTP